jgi:tight adherence protein B
MNLSTVSLPWIAGLLLAAAIFVAAEPIARLWDRLTRYWMSDLLAQVEALNIDAGNLTAIFQAWGALLIGVPLFTAVVLRLPILAPPLAALVFFGPRIWLSGIVKKRQTTIRSQLAGAMTGLSNTCRAGLPLAAGIREVAEELDEPLRSEFHWIVMNHQAGRPLNKVIEETKRRLDLEAFTLFSAALQTTLERGGRITEMLDRLSESIRDMDRLERLIESTTASSRSVIRILAIFPALFLLLFSVMFPHGTRLMFTTIIGQLILLLAGALICISIVWSGKILRFRL